MNQEDSVSVGSVELSFKQEAGKEALKFLQNNEVDIVLSDYLMPEMTGLELLEEIKTHGTKRGYRGEYMNFSLIKRLFPRKLYGLLLIMDSHFLFPVLLLLGAVTHFLSANRRGI